MRTFVGQPERDLLSPFQQQVAEFVKNVETAGTGPSESDIDEHVCGDHFFSIMGHDRQNKKVGVIKESLHFCCRIFVGTGVEPIPQTKREAY